MDVVTKRREVYTAVRDITGWLSCMPSRRRVADGNGCQDVTRHLFSLRPDARHRKYLHGGPNNFAAHIHDHSVTTPAPVEAHAVRNAQMTLSYRRHDPGLGNDLQMPQRPRCLLLPQYADIPCKVISNDCLDCMQSCPFRNCTSEVDVPNRRGAVKVELCMLDADGESDLCPYPSS